MTTILSAEARPNPQDWLSNTFWVENDARSVSAMLKGHGDGREKVFRAFERHCHDHDPDFATDELAKRYEAYVRDMVPTPVRVQFQYRIHLVPPFWLMPMLIAIKLAVRNKSAL